VKVLICNACCSVNTALEDNFWLLLGFLWCLLHFGRHTCIVCSSTSSVVGEVYILYHVLTVGMLPCLQIWLCRIIGALPLILSFQSKECNIICCSQPVKYCRSQNNVVKNMWFFCDWVAKTDFSQYCLRFGYSRMYSLIIQKVKFGDGMNNNCSRVSWNPFLRNY
jgi:hypothetical protein